MLTTLRNLFPKPLLDLRLEGRLVTSLKSNTKLPFETRQRLELPAAGRPAGLICTDSRGKSTEYDLRTFTDEGWRYLHFWAYVGPNFVVQMDALLSKDGVEPKDLFAAEAALRLQPFFLPECADAPDLSGKGTLARGLNYNGRITPGNVSHVGVCDACRRSFRFRTYYIGMTYDTYWYCGSGQHTLMFPLGDEPVVEVPCQACSGNFSAAAPFRCPHCHAPYINAEGAPEARERYAAVHHGTTVQHLEKKQD